jgi:hypothetical protein
MTTTARHWSIYRTDPKEMRCYQLKIHFNIIFVPTTRLSAWYLHCVHISHLAHTHLPRCYGHVACDKGKSCCQIALTCPIWHLTSYSSSVLTKEHIIITICNSTQEKIIHTHTGCLEEVVSKVYHAREQFLRICGPAEHVCMNYGRVCLVTTTIFQLQQICPSHYARYGCCYSRIINPQLSARWTTRGVDNPHTDRNIVIRELSTPNYSQCGYRRIINPNYPQGGQPTGLIIRIQIGILLLADYQPQLSARLTTRGVDNPHTDRDIVIGGSSTPPLSARWTTRGVDNLI